MKKLLFLAIVCSSFAACEKTVTDIIIPPPCNPPSQPPSGSASIDFYAATDFTGKIKANDSLQCLWQGWVSTSDTLFNLKNILVYLGNFTAHDLSVVRVNDGIDTIGYAIANVYTNVSYNFQFNNTRIAVFGYPTALTGVPSTTVQFGITYDTDPTIYYSPQITIGLY